MNQANRLNSQDFDLSVGEVIVKLADGNPGAVSAMAEMVKASPRGAIDLFHLDEMRMYGPSIWIGFSDFCKHDAAKFAKAVCFRDKEMVDFINACPGRGEGEPVIVGQR